MPRRSDSNEDLFNKGLTRMGSIGTTATHKVSIEAHPIKNQFTEESPDLRNGSADQPRKPQTKYPQELGDIHKGLATELFDGNSKSGLSVFQDYNGRPGNILTSLEWDNASVFGPILIQMRRRVTPESNAKQINTIPIVVREFLEHLVIKHHELLTQPNFENCRPLDTAARGAKPVVFLVIDLVLSEDKLRELPARACPAKLKARSTDVCHFDLPSSLQSAFAKDPGGGGPAAGAPGACLHERVKVNELERWSVKLKETVKMVLQPRKGEGPADTVLHDMLDEVSFHKDGSGFQGASFRRLVELCSKETIESVDRYGYCPLHKAILLYKSTDIDFGRLHDVICGLVQKSPSSIYQPAKGFEDTRTPYSMLQELKPRKEPDSGQQQQDDKVDSWSKTERLLKHTCIADERDRDEKLIYLYGSLKNARNIYLDMAFPDLIDKDFVTNLAYTVQFQFDTALEYVSLRRDMPNSHHLTPTVRDAAAQERNPYQGVFDWLKEQGVDKIISIIVEDLVPYPHTDKAIRDALKTFKVEKWDWRKLDICSQTIIDAAPETRELYLHSSGNDAVLRSWACESGLGLLKQLKSITITMHPDLRETKKDCDGYFKNFKLAFCRRRPDMKDSISVKWAGERPSGSNDAGHKASSDSNQSDQVAWVQTMKPFIDFMDTTIKSHMEEKKVKKPAYVTIALIDNGVYSAANLIPKLEKGKSWYGQRDPEMPFRDYFTGPSRHGTQMAQCIYKVCPMVQLYVARLDDSKPQLDKFTVNSAIEAIKWATKMGVDVISMSWTFPVNTVKIEQKTAFEGAIRDASTAGIILLGSLNDKEMTPFNGLYPISHHDVIRVGSATKWGEKAESSKRGCAHYLFPGQDISLPATTNGMNNNAGGGEDDVVSGSSLATAFAAGLAGLIIYTSRALICLDTDLSSSETQRLKAATSRAGMEQVYNVLSGRPEATSTVDMFVGLGSHFREDPNRVADEKGKVYVLRKLLIREL